MRDFDENNITAAVIARFQNTPDARLKEIMISLVRHLHDFRARCPIELRGVELRYRLSDPHRPDVLKRTGASIVQREAA
jgi:hypothetical protein